MEFDDIIELVLKGQERAQSTIKAPNAHLRKDEKTARLTQLITQAKDGYEKYKTSFVELQKAYLLEFGAQRKKTLAKKNKSSVYIPKLNAKVKYLITTLNNVYFSSERMADLEYYLNSNEDILRMWQEAIDFYTEKLNMFKIFQPFFLECSVLGTCVAKITWQNDFPLIEKIDLENIFFDPNATNSEDISYLVHQIFLNVSQIKDLQKAGVFDKRVRIDELVDEDDSDNFKKVSLYEFYEQKNGVWFVSTLLEQELLRDEIELKDGLPFVWGSMLPQLKKIDENENYICAYGEPVFSSMIPLQEEMNISRNLMIDACRAHISPKVVLQKSSGVTRADIETISSPVYLNEPGAITIFPPPRIESTTANLQILESEITEVSGISPQNNGAQTAKNETATEISIKADEGGRRVSDYVRALNETFVEPLFDRLALLVYRYGRSEFFAGYERMSMPSFRFKVQTGTGAMNKEVRRAGLQSSMSVFSQLYQMYMSIGDTQSAYKIIKANEKLTKELLPLLGVKNVSEFLSDEGVSEQMQNNFMLQQQAQQLQAQEQELQAGTMQGQKGDIQKALNMQAQGLI